MTRKVDKSEQPLVHFIFGLADDAKQRAFHFAHYLALQAANVHLKPSRILFHCHHLPQGAWWAEATSLVEVRHVEIPRTRSSTALVHAAHRADVLRLELLITYGGIYLDLDVVVLRPFTPFSGHEFAIAKEGDESHGGFHGLCNAVLISRPNASFARRWLAEYSTFGLNEADPWSGHSVQLPSKLAAARPSELVVLPYLTFFWPDWHEDELHQLLLDGHSPSLDHLLPRRTLDQHGDRLLLQHAQREDELLTEASERRGQGFAVHLWSSLSAPYVLSQWSVEYLSSVPSGLNCLLQATHLSFESAAAIGSASPKPTPSLSSIP